MTPNPTPDTVNGLADRAIESMHQAADAVRGSTHQMQSQAHQTSESLATYVRDEPVKALLMAAAAGAALVALLNATRRDCR